MAQKRHYRPVTEADVEHWRQLHAEGWSWNKIAQEDDRSHGLVRDYVTDRRVPRPRRAAEATEDVCKECAALEALYQAIPRRSKQRRCTKHGG